MLQRMLAVCWNLAVHCLCHSLDFFWGDSVFHIGFAGIIDVCCIEYIECMHIMRFGIWGVFWPLDVHLHVSGLHMLLQQ